MATVIEKTQLSQEYDNGMFNGKMRFKRKSYSAIKNDAVDTGLKAASEAIGTLCAKDLVNTKKIVTSVIGE